MTTTATQRRTRVPWPASIAPEQVVALVDSRENLPLDLSPLQTETAGLPTGDYSVKHLTDFVAIERKSLPDLLSCIGQERERFERELHRLLAYPTRAVVVEATWQDLEAGNWRSRVTAQSAIGSVIGWIAMGVPFVMAGNHDRAGRITAKLLFTAARRRYREARGLVELCTSDGE